MLWIRGLEDSISLKPIRHPHSDYQLGKYITFMVAFINYFKNLLRFPARVSQQLNTDFDKLFLLYCDMLEQNI